MTEKDDTVRVFTARNVTHATIDNAGNSIIMQGPSLDVHDGYHTMHELYEHRYALFYALCSQRTLQLEDLIGDYRVSGYDRDKALNQLPWMSRLHDDGLSLSGYFVAGFKNADGNPVSYHLPLKYWDKFSNVCRKLDRAPEFDGHDSDDVLANLWDL